MPYDARTQPEPGDGIARAHQSGLNLHRRCPQAWAYRYLVGLERLTVGEDATPPVRMHFGSWWAAWAAAFAAEWGRDKTGEPLPIRTTWRVMEGVDDVLDSDTATGQQVMDLAAAWWRRLPAETVDVWTETLGAGLPHLLAHHAERWVERWRDETGDETPLGVEVPWTRRIAVPEADRWEGGPTEIELFGTIDAIYRNDASGRIVIRDLKTSGSLSERTASDDLMDSQLQLYAWGVTPLLAEHGIDTPREVAYDRMRADMPKEPQLTKAGRLSKAVTLYDERTYREWADMAQTFELPKKDGGGTEVYVIEEAELERLRSPEHRAKFHSRTSSPISANVVRAHLRAAVDTALDAARTTARFERTGEAPRSLERQKCGFCDYAKLCRAQMVGGPGGEYDLAALGLVGRGGATMLTSEGTE